MKNYIIISGLDLYDTNRGTAALGYGSFSFLAEKGLLNNSTKVLSFRYYLNFLNKEKRKTIIHKTNIQGREIEFVDVAINLFEKFLFFKFNFLMPFGKLKKTLKQVEYVAAINGGDGFSDIYNTHTFQYRLTETLYAMKMSIPVIILPQTIGPFSIQKNREQADNILRYARKVYVRDDKYVDELQQIGVKYEVTKDLSYYMKPEPIDYEILPNAVGLNISGLAYSNEFRGLTGQFDNYKYLINLIIQKIQSLNIPLYLIPHSYNYSSYELNNDDMEASRLVYSQLKDKTNVHLIDRDLRSPQVKFCISQMSYFIGTRMHANFAAIYSDVPLYGLAYSYKFEGAFKANGVYDNNISTINNISKEECILIVEKIIEDYKKKHK